MPERSHQSQRARWHPPYVHWTKIETVQARENEIKSSIVENNRLTRTQMKQFNEYAKVYLKLYGKISFMSQDDT